MSKDNEMLVDLQTSIAFQEQTIAELNEALVSQQHQIDKLQLQLSMLNEKLLGLEQLLDQENNEQGDEKPPHY